MKIKRISDDALVYSDTKGVTAAASTPDPDAPRPVYQDNNIKIYRNTDNLTGTKVVSAPADPLVAAARNGGKVTPTTVKREPYSINAFGANVNAGKRTGNMLGAAITGTLGIYAEAAGQVTQPQGLTIGESARVGLQGGTREQEMAAEQEKAARTDALKEKLYAKSDALKEQSAAYEAAAKEGLGKVGQFMVDVGVGGTQLVGDIALGAINPALGTAALATRAFGGAAQQARQAGATETQQQLYGAASAATSILVEKIAQVGKLFKGAYGGSVAGGSVDDILNKVIGKVVKNPTLQRILGSAIGEGGEEALEAIIQPALQAIYDKGESLNKTWFTDNGEEAKEYLAEVGYNALLGATLGAVGAGGNANTPANAQNTPPNAAAPRIEGEGDSNTPAPQNGAEASVGGYRGDVPKNIERPHIGRLEMSSAPYNPDGADLSEVYGNRYRADVAKRATERLGIGKNKPAYLAAPNITKGGKEYYVDVTPASLNKMLYTEEHGRLEVERLLLVDNLEKAIDSSYWAESNPDRKGRVQIDGFDTLRTSFYVDGTPYYADIKVKVVRGNKGDNSQNVAYFLEPEEISAIKKADAPSPTDGRHAPNIFFKDNASTAPTVTPPEQNVKRDVFVEDVVSRVQKPSVGAADAGFGKFSALENKYGVIDGKARSMRPDDVPRSVDGKTKVSETISTMKGAEATPQWFVPVLEKRVLRGDFSTIPITNDETVQKAIATIEGKSESEAVDDWIASTKGRVTQDEIVMGQLLYNHAVNKGDERLANKIIDTYVEMGRDTARALQAMSVMQKLSPKTRLQFARSKISQMVKELDLNVDIFEDAKFKELEEAYLNAKSDKEADAILDDIAKHVATFIPTNFWDAVQAIRYTNMLGNLKTQVRNITGNLGMYGVSGIKDKIAANLQRLVKSADQTRSAVVEKEYRNIGAEVFEQYESLVLQQGKYQEGAGFADDFKSKVKEHQKINQTGIKALDKSVLAFYQKYNDLTQFAMNNKMFGDAAFAKKSFARAFGGYLKANGVTPEQWSNAEWQKNNGSLVEKAVAFAAKDAQENTFRNVNALAEEMARIAKGKSPVLKFLIEGLLPFRTTPANIFRAGFDYSPLGVVNTLVSIGRQQVGKAEVENQFLKRVQKVVGKEDITANDIIEQLSKGLTGTGIVALGAVLASLGLLRGGEDEDKNQAALDELQGYQPYSIEIGNHSYTLDWFTPASMPLFVGVELYNALSDGGISWSEIGDTLMSVANPMLEMSMMSGLNDAISNVQYSNNAILQFIANSTVNYLTQIFTNTLFGQIERTFEPNRMTTYVDKNKGMSWLQYAKGKASAKTPFWDYQQTEYIDAWGRTESNGSFVGRAFQNFLSPGYYSKISTDPLEAEIQRLYDATGENVFPERAPKSFTYDNKEVNLTAEQYKEYATTRGNELYDLMQKVVESSTYKRASDSGKAEMLFNAKTYADKKAKAEMGYRDGDSWATKADNAGIDPAAYIQYMLITDGLTSDKGVNGKTISGSKKKKVLAKINAMNITKAQKDALYRIEGYSENTISDAPWR